MSLVQNVAESTQSDTKNQLADTQPPKPPAGRQPANGRLVYPG